MNPVALIDANVPIYASGGQHLFKEPCLRVMRMIVEYPDSFVTTSEVLQEILHHYRARRQWTLMRELFHEFSEAMHGRIEPVFAEDVVQARALADDLPSVSSRDLVHAAVTLRLGVSRIISTDTDFDRLPVITRLAPERIDEWADLMTA